ncbi:MAG: rhodanese-like domain-containing protein [Acidimicrobiia bacterium]|nr:rhodanese-like domain-containing protein [Acidimicrobiia bacterium]
MPKSTLRPALAITLALVLALAACGSTATDTELALASAPEVHEILKSPPEGLVILDIRTPDEFAAGRIAGAINVDYYAADFEQRLGELDPNLPYVMYCNSGNRSGNTLPLMDSIGFVEVYELDGGIQAWAREDLPIEP